MRALALLVIVLVAFLAVRWLAPAPDPVEAGAPQVEEASDEAPAFLPPPLRVLEGKAEGAGAAAPVPEAPAPKATPAGFAQRGEAPAAASQDELLAARALAHGTPQDVQAAAAALPEERGLLLEAFAWAVAGERQMAHSLAAKLERGAGSERERALLEAALEGKVALPAGASGTTPVAYAMELALLAREAHAALGRKDHRAAAGLFSDLLVGDLDAPFAPDRAALAHWTEGLNQAQRDYRWNPQGGWPGVELEVASGDTLIGVRKRFLATHPEARMCTGLIERANRLSGHLQPGQKLRIPTDPARILVDLEARWALYFLGDEVAAAWPVGIGRPGEETPPGEYTAIEKTERPSWMKVGQDPIPFGDPRNPLGTRWIGWSRAGTKTTYGFHGTKDPESIGQAASDGCVRFLNGDVEELFQILPEGAPIAVRGG